jgi:hypothetical protein
MLKLRLIGQNDYRVLEGRQPIGRIRFASEHARHLALERHPEFAWPYADGNGQGPRHSQGRIQGGLAGTESQDTPEQLAAAYRATNMMGDEGRCAAARFCYL